MHSKENCCSQEENCGCTEKVHLHCLVHSLWDKLPESLKDMIHSLDKQKLAVLKELKTWADKNKHDELANACDKKMAKVHKRLTEENEG
ncbi:MAG: hypothetical protein J6P93_05360 [Alphaproteobacteria bacterium]|nr:hypothetical protein [Alphaproteobacteria bacterium]